MKVVIVNYGMGNIRSLVKKLDAKTISLDVSNDPSVILSADKLILPGVGHFGKAMENLRKYSLKEALDHAVLVKNIPVLGICLGMQLMAEKSEEGNENGLGWISGSVKRFRMDDPYTYKVPHTGWNTLQKISHHPLLKDVNENHEFYFVHAYHWKEDDSSALLATTTYAYSFASVVAYKHMMGVQFHPEKSHDAGRLIFRNFINY